MYRRGNVPAMRLPPRTVLAARDKATLGIALLIVALSAAGHLYPWIAVPLTLFAIFFVVWGRNTTRIWRLIGHLPHAGYIIQGLEQIDLTLTARGQFGKKSC